MANHKDLDVWKRSIVLVKEVYAMIKSFPDDERFGLVSQIRRSAVSVPSNIAEGAARSSDKKFIQFLYISLGSLSELETQLIIAYELSYLNNKDFTTNIENTRKMILGLISYLRKKGK
jgi:four helix bundle protein